MITVQCKICKTELSSTSKDQCCGCPNQMILKDDKVSAVNLGDVLIIKSNKSINNNTSLSSSDLQYQENRRQRKVRKLDFEVR